MDNQPIRKRPSKKALRKRRQRRRRRILILVIALLLLLIAAGAILFMVLTRNDGYKRYEFDTSAMEGRIQQMSEEEIQAELNRVVEEGMFNISIASTVVFPYPGAEGEARIENIAANRYHMQVDITLDSTGETIYSSKLIQPGFSIQNIRLNRTLEPGEYEATAVFSAITKEEMELFGQAAAEIKLYVLNPSTPTPNPTATPEAN